MEFIKKHSVILFSILVFVFAFLIRAHYITQKIGLFSDEAATFTIATMNNYGWLKEYDNRFYTGKELKEVTFKKINTYSGAFKNIKALYVDNNRDFAHTNLYYSIFNLWMVDKGDHYELKEFVNRACALNLLFFTLSFFIMYMILNRLFKDKKYIPLGLSAAFLNTASISNTLFIRPYQMQETAFLFLTFLFILIFQKISNDEKVLNFRNFALFSISGCFALLSGYFSGIYLFILLLSLIILCKKKSCFKNLYLILGAPIVGFVLANIVYKGYMLGFVSSRASGAVNLLNLNIIFKNLIFSIYKYILIFLKYIFSIPILLLGIYSYKNKDKNGDMLINIVIISALIWSIIVVCLAPFKIIRYIMPIIPIISIAIPYLLSLVKDNYKKVIYGGFLLLYVVSAIFASTNDYPQVYLKDTKLVPNIENTFQDWKPYFEATKNEDLPVVLLTYYDWNCFYLVGIVKDNQYYKFNRLNDDLPESLDNMFVLINYKDLKKVNKDFLNNYTIKKEIHFDQFIGYEIEKRRL